MLCDPRKRVSLFVRVIRLLGFFNEMGGLSRLKARKGEMERMGEMRSSLGYKAKIIFHTLSELFCNFFYFPFHGYFL